MNKIFICAYDRNNLGDDLFVHTITKRYTKTKFYVWTSATNIETFKSLPNLKVLDQDSQFVKFLKKIRPSFVSRYKGMMENRCEAVVYIGGSLFIEYDNWKTILTWWDYEAKNRNFYVLGANFGPYKTEEYREELANVFANTKDVCFRDSYSYEQFSEVPTVRYAPDILFDLDMPKRTDEKKRVFISVIDCKEKSEGINQFAEHEEEYLDFIWHCILISNRLGYRVTLSSFCKAEGDENAIKKIVSFLPEELVSKVDVINYDGTNAEEILQAISNSDFVIASRFHAAILGFVSMKPVLPIVYSDKTIHVLQDIQFQGLVLDLRKKQTVNFFELLENTNTQRLSNVKQLKLESVNHFLKLDKILLEKRNVKRKLYF